MFSLQYIFSGQYSLKTKPKKYICRQKIEMDNPSGGTDIYVLREDAMDANKGQCVYDCFYKKMGNQC